MNQDDYAKIVASYEKSFALYGSDARSVQWSNEETQQIRFEALCSIADLKNKKILDVGCGLGGLYKFFLTKNITVDYTGIDIVPAFVERAREQFLGAQFMCGNADSFTEEYDYILASGTFNLQVENATSYYFELLRHLFDHARIGLAFNMLDIRSHESDDMYKAYDKDEVVAFCRTLTPHVVLVDTYLTWDFTVYMYKNK
jgi:cyclopropane fatty-acyl-phospholipid synthase-like methyltransferase